ncbi:Eukaryotic translation initiation factor 3 subunit L [Halotydeus destructor]|nr:Eukaryotic translation initiation factor 3 subunit L [Halotydeus destructor]
MSKAAYRQYSYEENDDDHQYGSGEYDGSYPGSGNMPQSGSYDIPGVIQDFLLCLYKSLVERNVFEIQNLYENGFVQLTDSHYKSREWPDEHEVMSVIGERPQTKEFLVFYKELYYRHIYAKSQPTLEQRFESYFNYCALFNLLLSAEEPVPLELPNQWLWDIIDEFIYQFQSYSLFRMRAFSNEKTGKGNQTNTDIIDKLNENPKVWNVHSVLNVLHSLVDKSQINEQLREFSAGRDPSLVADSFGKQNLYKMLGYFSLIGLLRLHSLLGDYYQAIKVLENIDIHRQPLQNLSVARVLACQMATFYYVGFAYMMMRRYSDAIRTFCAILVYLQRTRQMYHQYRTFQMDMIEKQTDQMYVLLNICLVLYPQRIDESISSVLQEKYADSMIKMQRGDINEFETAFRFACPKFLIPATHDGETQAKQEPWKQQLSVFLDEVNQQLPILTIRSYLKLYTTLHISKLASLMEKSKDEVRLQLLAYKHKMQNVVWTSGNSGLEGEFQSGSDVDFYIDKDMIHVADTKVARRYGDYFLRQIHKFEELYRVASSLQKK